MQTITPYLLYEDAAAAIEWLERAFYVNDVDAHHARAVEAGATIHLEPEDMPYGDRRYDAEDLEGQRWSFAQKLTDVDPADWGAATP
jgi:uncharacterized glyoxalase superfamily protein PhnB